MAEPKVRFKRIDGSSYPAWRTIPMSEVFTEISEKNHPDLPVLSVQQGVGTVLRDSSDRNILYDKSNLKNYKAMKKDDYIIHLRSFEGGLECSNYDGISSPAYRILRSQAILPAAYRDYFRSYEFIHNKLAVSVVGIRDGKNIDMDTFWQIPMSVPSIEEQQKIADFLSSVDDVITASEEEVANLETQKKAVMKKIFSQEIRFKRADGSDFPEWEENALSERTSNFRSGKNIEAEKIKTEGIYPVIGGNGIRGYTDTYNHDGIYAVVGRQGALCGNVNLIDGKNYLTEHAVAVRGDDRTDTVFLSFLLDHMNLRKHSGQSAQPGLAVSEIIKLTALFPCIEEQRLIADFLSDFDEAIAAAKKELELWKELKKGLLQQMFV